jgi:hypothetical protein
MRSGAMQALRAGCIRAGWVLRCAAARWRRGGLVEYARAGFGDARTVHYAADAVKKRCAVVWFLCGDIQQHASDHGRVARISLQAQAF